PNSEATLSKPTVKRKKFKSTKFLEPRKIEIDETLIVVFVSCGLPFNIIENPFVINLLKVLCPEYNPPSRRLLDTQVAWVNIKIEQTIRSTSNLTICIDGWTSQNKTSLWCFIILTSDCKEYIYRIADYSNYSHTGEFLAQQ
ncbi:16101_t:CDS:2, partial [Racocetra persica]